MTWLTVSMKGTLSVLAVLALACSDASPVDEQTLQPEPESDPGRAAPPNIVLILADDLGYGDLGCYGSTTVETPHLDELAEQGVRFTQAYSGNSVCSPSRAVLLTGRSGPRQVLDGALGVYFPLAPAGMAHRQVTIAEVLSDAGYATALVGKWHLGDDAEYLPMRQGFDRFFGLPYSNDMAPLPLVEGEQAIDALETVDVLTTRLGPETKQAALTARFTEQAIDFIRDAHARDRPFFLYYPSHAPHTPLAASAAFAGASPGCGELGVERACGLYSDVVAELDWSVGQIASELAELGLQERTLIVFSSDNGPWLIRGRDGGSAGSLREGKGTTFEGGQRVPTIARWTGTWREGAVEETPIASADWLPTLIAAAGAELPGDRAIDGFDLGPLLQGRGPRDPSGEPFRFLYHRVDNATPGAYREGRWKYKAEQLVIDEGVPDHGELLFDLAADPDEGENLAAEYPEILERLRADMRASHAALLEDPLR